MKHTDISLGKDYTAFACSSRSYNFVSKERKPTRFSFFTQNQKSTTSANWLRDKMARMVLWLKKIWHIYVLQISTDPLWYTTLTNKGNCPLFHIWNNFGEGSVKSGKPQSYRTSPGKEIG